MTRITTFFFIAGISATAHAGVASDAHNPLTTGYGPPVDQGWGYYKLERAAGTKAPSVNETLSAGDPAFYDNEPQRLKSGVK